ncbi:hypothetical protein MTO96_018113 [Rhipicephalus appendiculatus]
MVQSTHFAGMPALRSLSSADGTWMTPRVREAILEFKEPRASFKQIEGKKNAPVAPLAETSLLENFKLVHQSGDFSGSDYVLGGTIKSSEPEGWIRVSTVSSRPFISLIDLNIADEPKAVKINVTMRSTSSISARTMTRHAGAVHFRHCHITKTPHLGCLSSIDRTSRPKRDHEYILKFKKSRAPFERTEGEKNAPVARLAETSLLDNFQLGHRSKDFSLASTTYSVRPSNPRSLKGWIRASTGSSCPLKLPDRPESC